MGGRESKKGSKSESRKDSRKEGSAGSRGSSAKEGKAKEESIKGAQSQNVDSKKSKSGAGVELYRAAAPGSCVPLNYGPSRSSALDCHGQYSGEPALKGSSHSPQANSGQRLQDSGFQISPQYADSQSPSDLEENFVFSIEEVPLAFGGLSKLRRSPIDPSQLSAAASIFGTESQYYQPEFSATAPSSSGRDMAGKSQWSESSTHETTQRSASNADPSFHVHDNKYFAPGCLIRLTWFDDSEMGLKDGEEISDEEFLRRRRARKGTPRMFMLFRTFPNYSMAVPVHIYSREELSKPAYSPQHHAIIYSGKRIPPLQDGEKRPGNPPIRVETTEELPTSSRLNYGAVFTIEHTFPLAFVGKISLTDWEAFADSYAAVQRITTGYDVQPPSADPEVGSDFPDPQSPPFCDDIDPPAISSTIHPHQQYITTGYAYVASDPKRSPYSHEDYMSRETGPSTVQDFQSPTSPGSDASATQEGTSSTSSGSWLSSFGSEAPLSPFHAVNSTSKKTEVGQKGYSPISVNYAQNGLQALRLNKPLVQSFISPEQAAANKSMKWINDATNLRCNMMLSVQQGRSVRSLCSPSNSPSSTFVPSRVKVAILDSAANVYGPYFKHCINRVKGFYDFIGDGQSTPEVTHGVHVASLLMHMAPDIDLYFARVLDGRDASLGAGRLTKAIKYAIQVWKVDIISISGGMHEHDYDLEDALALARHRHVAVFAATHNHGKNKQMAFPARDLTVIGVSSCDPEGKLSRSAALAKEGKTNFSALGENIPPFWMGSRSCLVPRPLSGSSFAAPIVVGVYATTLLAARLSFRNDADAKLREKLASHAVRERLMLVLSMKNESSKYHSLTPELLWNQEEGWTAAQIKHHIDHVDKGLPYH